MKKAILYGNAIVLLSLVVLPAIGLAASASDKVVAKVGAVKITQYELAREQQKLLPFNVSFHKGLSKEKMQAMSDEALNKLIDRAYKVNSALAEELSISKSTLDEKISSVSAKFKDEKDFEQALGGEGISEFRLSVWRELLAQVAEKKYIDDKINVTEKDLIKYYEENKSSYIRPKQFKASHIMVKVDPASNKQEKDELLKRTNTLYDRAKAGEDFYNLAYYNSDDRSKFVGGDLGYFHVGQTVKEFEDQVQKMKVGEISPPIKTMYGYHIIKLVEVNESRQLAFDEVKNKIREMLEKKERDRLYKGWMDGLKLKYPVER